MTQLPIDYSKRPFKDKYVTSETHLLNDWFIFGEREDGTVDISDSTEDIFMNVPRDAAARILKAREDFLAVIMDEIGYKQDKDAT